MDESPRLKTALEKLQRLAAGNAPQGTRINAEQEYSLAYEELVRQGLKHSLRGKYRIR